MCHDISIAASLPQPTASAASWESRRWCQFSILSSSGCSGSSEPNLSSVSIQRADFEPGAGRRAEDRGYREGRPSSQACARAREARDSQAACTSSMISERVVSPSLEACTSTDG